MVEPNPMLGRKDQDLFALLFANFLLYGGVTTLVGATLPLVIRQFSWSYLATGAVLASGSVGYFATTFLAGLVVTRIGPQRLITFGLGLQVVGVGCFGTTPNVGLNMAALVLLGIGQGTTEIVTNYSVVQMEPTGTSRLMNLMHSAFTIGAVATPALAAFLIDLSDHWRRVYLLAAGASFCLMLLLRIRSLPFAPPRRDDRRSRPVLGTLARQPLLFLLALMIFLYVGAEIGISSWISEFYVTNFGSSPAVGAVMVSIFWLGILLGRLLTSAFYRGAHQAPVLIGFATLAMIALLAALVSSHSLLAGTMFFVTGLGFSAIYPIGITMTGKAFPQNQGPAIGLVSTGGGLGACLFPFLMAAIANDFGMRSGFWFYLGVTTTMLLTMLGILLTFAPDKELETHSSVSSNREGE